MPGISNIHVATTFLFQMLYSTARDDKRKRKSHNSDDSKQWLVET